MADITDDCTIHTAEVGELKLITVRTPATADDADTLVLTLKNYGIKTFLKCVGTYQSTANSVAVEVAFVTSVTNGVLTVTLDSTAGSDKQRIAQIWGSC